MIKILISLYFFILAFFVSGCATSRSVVEMSKFNGDFAKYSIVAVELEDNPKIKSRHEPEKLIRKLKRHIDKIDLFKNVTSTPNDPTTELIVKIRITNLDAAEALGALLVPTMTNSEVKVLCTFIEKKKNRTLATLEAMGNSKNSSRTLIGGIGVTDTLTYTDRAYENAAEAIAKYMKDHHSGRNAKRVRR